MDLLLISFTCLKMANLFHIMQKESHMTRKKKLRLISSFLILEIVRSERDKVHSNKFAKLCLNYSVSAIIFEPSMF